MRQSIAVRHDVFEGEIGAVIGQEGAIGVGYFQISCPRIEGTSEVDAVISLF